jgi:hypothetical protein
MRRLLAALLIVLLPLQWGWAVAAAPCPGDRPAPGVVDAAVALEGSHAGPSAGSAHVHHLGHDPAPPAPGVDGADAGATGAHCAMCHLSVALPCTTAPAAAQACPRDGPRFGDSAAVREPPLQRPFRPPMTGL